MAIIVSEMSAPGTKLTSQPVHDRKNYLHVISRFGL